MSGRNRRGFTIIAAVFIILVVAVFALVTLSFVSSDAVISVKNYYSLKVFYISEAGAEYYTKQLKGDSDWTTPPTVETKAVGGGYFSIVTSQEAQDSITFTSMGVLTIEGRSYTRAIRISLSRSNILSDLSKNYAIYMGSGDGATIGNSSIVRADVFVSGNLTLGSGAQITGDAAATGNISGGTVLGSRETYVPPPANPPTLDSAYYDNLTIEAKANPTYPRGNRNFSGSLAPGTHLVDGNVTIGSPSQSTLTLTGVTTIVATGSILIGNSQTIGNYLTVIAAGPITIGNSSRIGDGGLWYSGISITMGNSPDIADVASGIGTAFITPGNIVAGNSCDFKGLVFAGGSLTMGNSLQFSGLIVAEQVTIGNSAILSANPALSIYDIPGVSGNLEGGGQEGAAIDIVNWGEI
ncbi:MAG: hypothetical protein PHG97_02785 [Candidatus Margulisbacteria bacterium]|nr:hypothetical protein [Candidatus Margulisiibacteriota bacterium]